MTLGEELAMLAKAQRDAAHWEAACRDAHDQAEKAEAKVARLRSALVRIRDSGDGIAYHIAEEVLTSEETK